MVLTINGSAKLGGNFTISENIISVTLLEAITTAGLTSNLVLALDAADINSYSGSGQDWLDTSGAGNADEFHRGATTGSEGSDPTFNGVAGDKSENEYWSFDGGDFFRYGAANETWMESFHKNNADVTILAAIHPASANSQTIFDTRTTNNNGISVRVEAAAGGLTWQVDGGTAQNVFTSGGLGVNTSAWNIVGFSVDEAAGGSGSFAYVNGTETTFDGTYTSPTAGASTAVVHIGDGGSEAGVFPMANGTRFAWIAAWDISLTAVQVDALYEEVKTRFSL